VQSGEFTFRYVLTSGAELNPAALSRAGREALTPIESGELMKNDKVGTRGSLPAVPASFLTVSGDGIELEALKPAEDGNGYILRLLETSGRAGVARLSSLLLKFDRAWLCNAAEDNERELSVSKDGVEVAVPPYAIMTLRAVLRPAAP
jgi:alpha-mannosidase